MTPADAVTLLALFAVAALWSGHRAAVRDRCTPPPPPPVDWYTQLDEADLAHRTQGIKAKIWTGVER